jgi:hypothetical protein
MQEQLCHFCITPLLHTPSLRLVPRLQASPKRGILFVSTNGGVLVSTEGLMTGSHAEDDSLASLKIESKNQLPTKNWLSRLN